MPKDCVFCRIARGETPTDILHATDQLIVFRDIRPQAPVHLLIVPRKHIRSVNDLAAEDAPILGRLFRAAQERPDALKSPATATGWSLTWNAAAGRSSFICTCT